MRSEKAQKLNMGPVLSFYDVIDMAGCNSVFAPKRCLRNPAFRISISHVNNLLVGKNSIASGFSTRHNHSTFVHHVGSIILFGSKPKMIRINTKTIIASVADTKAVWNCAFENYVGNSVGLPHPASNSEHAISVIGLSSGPQPTAIGYLNPAPKSFNVLRIEVVKRMVRFYDWFSNFSIHSIEFVSAISAHLTLLWHVQFRSKLSWSQ
jgi:hypothetical protein